MANNRSDASCMKSCIPSVLMVACALPLNFTCNSRNRPRWKFVIANTARRRKAGRVGWPDPSRDAIKGIADYLHRFSVQLYISLKAEVVRYKERVATPPSVMLTF